jgi:hypothetical protein
VYHLDTAFEYKLIGDINSKLVLIDLMAAWTECPRLPEFSCTISLLTFDFCIFSKAGEVHKSGICATTSTVASQWLIRLVSSPSIKAQVAHRHPVVT